MIPLDHSILGLAGYGIPGAPPLQRHGWSQRLDGVLRQGLAGFLARANTDGAVELDAGSRELVVQQLTAEAIRAVQLEGELIRIAPVLAELPGVVLKGAVLAHGAYPDPALRPFTDLDLLVAGRSHDDAVRAFEALGYVRSRPEPAPGYDAHVGKALTLVHPGGVVIDLHRTLVDGRLGVSIDVDQLLEERVYVVLGGVRIPAPSWEAHLVETALHAVVGDGLSRALSIRDVAQVALLPHLDGDRAVALAARWNVTDTVAVGLTAAVEGLGLRPPGSLAGLAASGVIPEANRPRSVRSAESRLDDLRHGDLRRRVTLMRSMVAPSPAFLRWNYGAGSLPKLYGRRWATLYRRATEAGSDPPAGAPAELQPPTARGSDTGATGAGRSRQERWSETRPPRPVPAQRTGARRGDGGPPAEPPVEPAGSDGVPDEPDQPRRGIATAVAPNGVRYFIGGLGLVVVTAVVAQFGIDYLGVVSIPVAALLFAVAASRRISRTRPDESWVGRWLIIATFVKVAASYARYLTLIVSYEGVGDSTDYDEVARQLVRGWRGDAPVRVLENLRQTNFLRWFTGVVYFLFGSNMVAGFFLFGLLALVGSYFWFRATADAVPFIDKRLYLGLVLFAPSIAFWPSSIGKESLMQLGIGAASLGTAFLLRQRLLPGLVFGLAGGWLLWVVRPHLLALVALSAGFAYLIGRVRPSTEETGSLVVRTLGLVVIAFLVAFAVGQGAEFLGIKDYSLSSVETALDEQSAKNTNESGSFDNGGNYLSPVNLPRGAATVLLRPYPWETTSPFQLLASLESVIVAGFLVFRFSSIRTSLVRARGTPFLLYAWIMVTLYAATFSSFSNFGLLVRQRSLVLPALFVLIAVRPSQPDAHEPDASEASAVHGGGP